MRTIIKTALLTAAAGAAAAALATPASAACSPDLKPAAFSPVAGGEAHLTPAAYEARSVVGMWSFTFHDDNGNVVDFGYQQWHSDGTEIMNSGSRAPATENFCLGVWSQSGPYRYALNHFTLSYDASTGKLNAKGNIKEEVVVDPTGMSFTGPFSLTVYDPNGKRLQKITGRVDAQRITISS